MRAGRYTGEDQVVGEDHDDESDALSLGTVNPAIGCELLGHGGSDDECDAGTNVAEDQRRSSSDAVEENDAKELTDKTSDGVDGVDQKSIFGESDAGVDIVGVVLDSRDTGHLNRELQNNTVEDLSQIDAVAEDDAP